MARIERGPSRGTPSLPESIKDPAVKLGQIAGIAEKVFDAQVTEKDLLAMLVLSNVRLIEQVKGNYGPGLYELAEQVGELAGVIDELDQLGSNP